MNMPVSDTKTNFEQIVKIYKYIYKYFFKYLIFVVTIIISFFIFLNILDNYQTSNTSNGETNDFIIKQTELILNFNKSLRQSTENTDVKIDIIQGYLNTAGNYLESANNLISYKGFILPRFLYIYKTLPLKDISYFDSTSYEPRELDNFIQNIILVKKENTEKPKENAQLPLKGTINNTFDLNCLFKNKVLQKLCNNALADFLDSFFVYNINTDYNGLKNVYNQIKNNTENKQLFCNGLQKYIIYSNNTSSIIEDLISSCSDQTLQKFKKLKTFIEIQQQISSKQITTSIYNNNDINEYKLLSIMQIIYSDIINNRTDTTNTLQYLNFVKETLKENKIDAFYKDLIYRFNNHYIKPRVENPDNPINKNNKVESLEISKQIIIINNGSDLYGFKGLVTQTKNPNILPIAQKAPAATNLDEVQKTRIIKMLENISYLKIKNKNFSGDILFVNADLFIIDYNNNTSINNKNTNIKLDVTFSLSYQNNEFIINKIKIANQAELNTVIKQLITNTPYSLNQTVEYIQQNYALYNKTISTSTNTLLCDQILNKLKDPTINIISCTKNNIKIDKKLQDQTSINYDISFDNFNITNVTISDTSVENDIKEKIKNILTNEINFANTISSIIYYTKPTTVVTTQLAENIIIATDKIKNYLGIKINDIVEKNNKILVQFSIGGIDFIGNYILKNSTIYPIYFSEVLTNNLPTKITNLSLSLDDQNKTDIYNFISDPLSYIQKISPESYMLYIKFTSPPTP